MDVIAGLFQVYENRKQEEKKNNRNMQGCFGKREKLQGILKQLVMRHEKRLFFKLQLNIPIAKKCSKTSV